MARRKKKTKAEQIASIPIEQIGLLKGEEGKKQLINYVRTMRMGYNRRVQSFSRRGVFSYAQYSFEESAPKSITTQLTKLTRNQLIGEFARYQKFFNDRTSSIEGIKEVNLAQDIRLFGEDKKGKPLYSLNEEQREKFWNLYDEYKNQHPTGVFRYSSESVQQILASVVFDYGDELDFIEGELGDVPVRFFSVSRNYKTVTSMLLETEIRLAIKKEEEDMEATPNVYSGRGPYRSR